VIRVADMNQDGKLEVVGTQPAGQTVSLLLNEACN